MHRIFVIVGWIKIATIFQTDVESDMLKTIITNLMPQSKDK
jgi:hypothetical protein